jgi:hypothetical protein
MKSAPWATLAWPIPTQGDILIYPDDHAASMPLDFFGWAVRDEARTTTRKS